MKRAQVAYEFLIVVFFLTLLFTVWIVFIGEAQEQTRQSEKERHLEDLSLKIEDDLYTAIQMPEGFTRIIELPHAVAGHPYTINQVRYGEQDFMILEMQGYYKEFAIPPINTGDTFTQGENTITHQGGTLHVS